MSCRAIAEQAAPVVRPALKVGAVNDPTEVEADAVADMVMSMPSPDRAPPAPRRASSAVPTLRRACGCGCGGGGDSDELRRQPEDDELQLARDTDVVRRQGDEGDEEENVQRKVGSGASGGAVGACTARRIDATRGGGAPLPSETRRFFEPRFGADLSGVRVHAGSDAAAMASSVQARAFTVGNDVYFGSGEYRPTTNAGRHLLAHELTHTLQSDGSTVGTVRRRVNAALSNCPANVHDAPASPLAELREIDEDAERMALGASNVLVLEALTRNDATFGPSYVSRAYVDRFGSPAPTSNGRFSTAFTGNLNFASEGAAISAAMLQLAGRFERVARFFRGNLDYDCPGTSLFTISGCTSSRCQPNTGMVTCPTGTRRMIVCAAFWNSANDSQRAGMLVHEAMHILFRFRNHNAGTGGQRRANPECYTSFLADIYNFSVWDTRCPV